MELISLFFLTILGVIVGCFGTLIGIGGGFIIVPLLILIYGFEPKFAVGTSLTIVFLNALSGSFAYIRQRRVDFKIGVFFALLTIPGAILGAYIVNFFSSNLFKGVFSLILILASFKLIISKPVKEKYCNLKKTGSVYRRIIDYNGNVYEYSISLTKGLLINFFIGFISSIFGVGGGIIHVPAMILLLGFPVHIATATSLFISIFTSITGALTHISLSNVKFNFAIFMGVGTIIGAQFGALISQKIEGTFIKKLLGLALLTLAIRLLLEVF
ncbi:sulfite exporter TauE/SafE family protein [Candidatus Bathyarchaeota archaeon]|nr:sulfite exporter TauE/SafE family protein [Candidatus Bathyarchaeota archaeon]